VSSSNVLLLLTPLSTRRVALSNEGQPRVQSGFPRSIAAPSGALHRKVRKYWATAGPGRSRRDCSLRPSHLSIQRHILWIKSGVVSRRLWLARRGHGMGVERGRLIRLDSMTRIAFALSRHGHCPPLKPSGCPCSKLRNGEKA
jgi:hypothetical protein